MRSTRLHYAQVRAALQLLDEVRELVVAPDRQRVHFANGLAKLLGADAVMVARGTNHATPVAPVDYTLEFNEALAATDRAAMVDCSIIDPVTSIHLARVGVAPASVPVTVRRQEFIRDRAWYRSGYYNEVRRVAGFDHAVCTMRRLEGRYTMEGVVMFRSVGARAFAAEDAALVDLVHVEWARLRARYDAPACLSPRERETFELLLEGRSYKDLATSMRLSVHTVSEYAKEVYRKLGVHGRSELQARWPTRR